MAVNYPTSLGGSRAHAKKPSHRLRRWALMLGFDKKSWLRF